MLSEMTVRRLVEAGNGRTIKVNNHLMAWVHVDDNNRAHVHLGCKSVGKIVESEEMDLGDLTISLKLWRVKYEASLRLTVNDLRIFVKILNETELWVTLVSPFCDAIVDEERIKKADLFDWINNRQDW